MASALPKCSSRSVHHFASFRNPGPLPPAVMPAFRSSTRSPSRSGPPSRPPSYAAQSKASSLSCAGLVANPSLPALIPRLAPTAGSKVDHPLTYQQQRRHPPCCSRCSASSPIRRPYSASPKPTAPAHATSLIASPQLMPMTTTLGSRSAWRSTAPVMTPSFKIGSAGLPSQASSSLASAKPSGSPSTAHQVASALAPSRT